MPFSFSKAPDWAEGRSLFLGLRKDNRPAGIITPRHLITIAGARSGKGAGLIIPNLLSWNEGSVLVIDPKGENAEATWQDRVAMGHKVYVVDPFNEAKKIPDRLRASFNPLDAVDPSSIRAREDIRVIADGLVMRYNAKDAMWDNGAVSVLSGLMAHILTTAPPEYRNLNGLRLLLQKTDDDLADVWEDMAQNSAMGGLAKSAASVGLSEAKSAREFVKGAKDNTEWLDSEAMQGTLGHSDFRMSDLKNGQTAVYLVLPSDYLAEHGRFLRLFVRCALSAMAQGGQGGGKCLFLLDEFFSLGHIGEIAKAAGLMPSYGVHLWPFLQDLGQLVTLYGKEGAETFFGNADAHIFFGNTDQLTLDHVSIRLGRYGHDDMTTTKPFPVMQQMPTYRATSSDPAFSSHLNRIAHETDMWKWEEQRGDSLRYHHESAAYEADARKIGQPRFPPEVVREMVAKHDGDELARSMLVFNTGGRVLWLKPHGWWMPLPAAIGPSEAEIVAQAEADRKARIEAEKAAKQQARIDAIQTEKQAERARLTQTAKELLQAGGGLLVAMMIAGWVGVPSNWLTIGLSLIGGLLLAGAGICWNEAREV